MAHSFLEKDKVDNNNSPDGIILEIVRLQKCWSAEYMAASVFMT
jgi:hypothetical protein